jgi:acyl-CoA-binding protein
MVKKKNKGAAARTQLADDGEAGEPPDGEADALAKLRARAQQRNAAKAAATGAVKAPAPAASSRQRKTAEVEKRTMETMLPHVDNENLAASASALRQHIRASQRPLPPAALLELAALHQQATEGDAPAALTEGASRQERARWRCWDAKRGASQMDARRSYVGLVAQCTAPGHMAVLLCSDRSQEGQRVVYKRSLPWISRGVRVVVIADIGVGEQCQLYESAGPAPVQSAETAAVTHVRQVMEGSSRVPQLFHSLPPAEHLCRGGEPREEASSPRYIMEAPSPHGGAQSAPPPKPPTPLDPTASPVPPPHPEAGLGALHIDDIAAAASSAARARSLHLPLPDCTFIIDVDEDAIRRSPLDPA